MWHVLIIVGDSLRPAPLLVPLLPPRLLVSLRFSVEHLQSAKDIPKLTFDQQNRGQKKEKTKPNDRHDNDEIEKSDFRHSARDLLTQTQAETSSFSI